MDLASVVTHEVGHVLGFEHTDTGVMEAALAPGARLVPEALPGTGNTAAAAASPGGPGVSAGALAGGTSAVTRAGDLAVAQPGVPLSALSGAEASSAAFTAAPRGGLALPAAAGAFQDGAGRLRSLPGVLLNLAPQAPPVLSTAGAAPAAGAAGADRDSSGDLVPGLQPPAPRVPGDSGTTSAGGDGADEVPADRPAPAAEPAGTPVAPEAVDAIGALSRRQATDACFAGGSWMDGPGADAGQAVAPAAAVAVLGALSSHLAVQRGETETRRRPRYLI
jgi:hypothetical protein